VFGGKRKIEDFSAEIEAHLQCEIDRLREQGLSEDEARATSQRAFGNVTRARERFYESGRLLCWDHFCQDVRYGARMLRKSPGFSIVAVLTLALGIGANTLIFSVVNKVLLEPLPYEHPDRILRVYSASKLSRPLNIEMGSDHFMSSPGDIDEVRSRNDVFAATAFFQEGHATLTGLTEPEQVETVTVSQDFFSVFGIKPLEGRTFITDEFKPGRAQAVVVSHPLMRRLFRGGIATAQRITLDGKTFTVVGVMPEGFHFPDSEPPVLTDVWLPWTEPINHAGANRDVAAVARLQAGVTLEQARTNIALTYDQIVRANPLDGGWSLNLTPLQADANRNVRSPILAIFGSVGFVLLVACANVGGLLLARGTRRRAEIAVRAALGASRARIIGQLLTECGMLSVCGGVAGVALAFAGVPLIIAAAPQDIPRLSEVTVNTPVLLFAAATSILVGLAFGLLPALHACGPSLEGGLREAQGIQTTLGHQRGRPGVLVAAQLAASLVLMIGAGLMVRSFLRLTSVSLGFEPHRLLTFWINPSNPKYAQPAERMAFYQRTLERIGALPGVEGAALANFLAVEGGAATGLRIDGAAKPGHELETEYKAITPDYFQVMGIRFISGRAFTSGDRAGTPMVAVVNQAFVRQYMPHEDPIGKRINLSWGGEPKWRDIVGVARNVRQEGVMKEADPEVYVPLAQAWIPPNVAYLVRTRVQPSSLTDPIRRAILALDKDQPIAHVRTMDEILGELAAQPRFRAVLLGLFSLLAVVIAGVGLYGLVVYWVSSRTHELGVRMALGAQPSEVVRLILRDGMVTIGAGLAVGVAVAFALTRLVASLLFGVDPTDSLTFAGVPVLLAVLALGASYIPARRAMRVDPMVALRYE